MAGSDGAASIELILDRSKFDADIRSLQSQKLKPIALSAEFNTAAIDDQLKALKVKPISVGLTLDVSGLNQQLKAVSLKPIRVAVELDARSVDGQLRSLKPAPIELKLSTEALDRSFRAWRDKALTQGLQVPITFKADTAAIRSEVANLRASIASISVPVRLQYSTSDRLAEVKQSVRFDNSGLKDLEKGIGESVSRGVKKSQGNGLFGNLGNLITAPLRNASRGFQEGIGLAFSEKFAAGYIKSLESDLGVSFQRIGASAGEKLGAIGKFAGNRIVKNLGIEEGLEGLKPRIAEFRQYFSEIIDEKALNRKFSVLELSVGKLIDDLIRLKGVSQQLANIKDVGGAIADIAVTPAEGIKERRREVLKQSYAKAEARSQFIQAPQYPEGTESAIIGIGGFAGTRGKSSPDVARRLQLLTGDKNPVVPVSNVSTDLDANIGEGQAKFFVNGIKKFVGNAIKGVNEDAIEATAQAIAIRRANPNLPVNFAGYSAGGNVAQEAVEISKAGGIASKGVGIGTPRFGLNSTTTNDEFRSVLGAKDPLSKPSQLSKAKDAQIVEDGGANHKLSEYLGRAGTQNAIRSQLGIKGAVPDAAKSPAAFELQGFDKELESLSGELSSVLSDPKQSQFFKKTGLYQTYLEQIKQHRAKLSQLIEGAAGDTASQIESYDEFLVEAESLTKQAFGVQSPVAPAVKAASKPIASNSLGINKESPLIALQAAQDEALKKQLESFNLEVLKEISRASGQGTPKGKKTDVVSGLLEGDRSDLEVGLRTVTPLIQTGVKGGQSLGVAEQTDGEKRVLRLAQESEKRINDTLRLLQTAEGDRRKRLIALATQEIEKTNASLENLTKGIVAPQTRATAGQTRGRLSGLKQEIKKPKVNIDDIKLARVNPIASAKNFVRSDNGKAVLEDLAVNTVGFAASQIGNQFGAIPGLAGDLGGALAARQAINLGKASASAFKSLKSQEKFINAKKLEQFKLLAAQTRLNLQSQALQKALGNNLTGDLTGFAIGNGFATAANAGLDAISGTVPGANIVRAIPFKGAIAAAATVPRIVRAREKFSPEQEKAANNVSLAKTDDKQESARAQILTYLKQVDEYAAQSLAALESRKGTDRARLEKELKNYAKEQSEYVKKFESSKFGSAVQSKATGTGAKLSAIASPATAPIIEKLKTEQVKPDQPKSNEPDPRLVEFFRKLIAGKQRVQRAIGGIGAAFGSSGLAKADELEPEKPQPIKPIAQKTSGLFDRLRNAFDNRAQKTYEALVTESAKVSGIAIKPGDIPKLKIDDGQLKAAGIKALYNIKQNQIIISKETHELLKGNADQIASAQKEFADIVHESRHAFQFDFGRSSLLKQAAGGKSGVPLIDPANVSQDVRFNAARSAQVANQEAGGLLPKPIQRRIAATEVDAYAFEKIATPTIVSRVADLKREKEGKFNLPDLKLPDVPIPDGLKKLAGVFNASSNGVEALRDRMKSLIGSIDSAIPGSAKFLSNIKGIAIGFVGFQVANQAIPAIKQFGDESLQAAIKADNLRTALNFSAGSSAGGAKSLEFVRSEVDRLGIPLESAQKGFSQLSAATKGSVLAGQTTKDIFTGMASAATVLGLSSDDATGALTALTQIASKGTASTEDLRDQLGTRIPGAFQVAARAIGVTDGELSKLLETGSVISNDFLPKFAKQLQIEFGGSAESASQNLQSSLFRVNNSFLRLQESTGAAIAPAATAGAIALSGALNFVSQNANVILGVVGTLATVVGGQLAFGLIKSIVASKLLAVGLSGAAGIIPQLLTGFKSLAIEFGVVALAGEVLRANLDLFSLSDKAKQFDDFGEQGEKGLDRIAAAARKAKGEIDNIPAEPKQGKSKGIDFSLGLAKASGLEGAGLGISFKSDDFLNSANRLQEGFNGAVGLPKDFLHATTAAEKTQQDDTLKFEKFNTAASKTAEQGLSGRVSRQSVGKDGKIIDEGKTDGITDLLLQTQGFDNQIAQTRKQRSLEQSLPQPDKVRLKQLDDQEKDLTAKKSAASSPVVELQGQLQTQLKNAKAGLDNPDLTSEEKKALDQTVISTQAAIDHVQKLTDSIKTSASATRDLNNAFTESALRLQNIKEANANTFKRQQIDSVKGQVKDFGADQNASIKAPLDAAGKQRNSAIADFESSKAELESLQKEINKPANQDVLTGIKIGNTGRTIGKDSSIADLEEAQKGVTDPKDVEKKKVLERFIEFKKGREKLTDLEKTAEDSELALIKAKENAKIAVIDKAFAQRASSIKRLDANAAIATLSKRATNNVSDEDLGIEEAKSQKASVDRETQNANIKLSDLNQAKQQGLIGAEEYQKRVQEIQDSLTDLAVKSANAELAIVQAKNKKIIEGYERTYKVARALISTSTASASIGAKQSQLNGTIVGEGGATQQNEIEITSAQRKFELISQQETALQGLRSSGAIGEKDFTDRSLALTDEAYQTKSQLVDLYTKKVLTGIQAETDAQKRASDRAILDLNRQKSAQDSLSAKLDIRKGKLDTELKLSQALNESAQSALKIQSDRSGDAAGSFGKLQEKGIGRNARKVLRDQLDAQGFDSGDKKRGVVTALQLQNNAELQAENRKLDALKEQQRIELTSVRLGLEKEKISARIAAIESQRAENSAKIAFNEAQGGLRKAQLTGDKNEIANAQSQVELTGQNVQLAGQSKAIAENNVTAVDDRALGELSAKTVSQQTAQNELGADTGRRRRARELGIAEAADKAKLNGSQYSTIDRSPDFADLSNPLNTAKDQFEQFRQNTGVPQSPSNAIVGTGRLPLTDGGTGAIDSSNNRLSNIQAGNSNGVSDSLSQLPGLVTGILSKLDAIGGILSLSSNKPSNLYVSTPQPVADAAKIYSDISKRQVGDAGL